MQESRVEHDRTWVPQSCAGVGARVTPEDVLPGYGLLSARGTIAHAQALCL